jgi:hypothetical protein
MKYSVILVFYVALQIFSKLSCSIFKTFLLYIQINQPHESNSQIYCLSFKYSSTCFEHPHAHHQELINCSIRLWFTAGTWDRPRPTTLLPPLSNGKPEAATAVDKLLMMGMRMPETCWAVFKRQAINLRDWCIWLVDLFEYMMMHGFTNPKLSWSNQI